MTGRKTVIVSSVVAKLTDAFRLGYNDEDACQYAEIDRSTYYRHLQSDLSFATQMADAKSYARLLCCSVLLEAIEHKNVQVCQWWLERRYREQFGKSTDITLQKEQQKEQEKNKWEELRKKYTINKPNEMSE